MRLPLTASKTREFSIPIPAKIVANTYQKNPTQPKKNPTNILFTTT